MSYRPASHGVWTLARIWATSFRSTVGLLPLFLRNLCSRRFSIAEDDLDIVVQPGVGYEALNAELKERGIPLMFPVDPAPGASELSAPFDSESLLILWLSDRRNVRNGMQRNERCALRYYA